MKWNHTFFGLMLMVFCISACVPAGLKTTKTDPKLAEKYIAQAQQLEKKGELPEALEQYKLALTVDPKNQTAVTGKNNLTQKLKVLAEERFQLGMKYYRKGKYGLARKEFLTALKFDPEHPEASRMLVSRQPEKTPQYRFHVIQPGESLSQIANQYYGDYRKYDVIARFNRLEDVTRIKPGQRIMIPEIAGILLPPTETPSQGEEEPYVLHTIQYGESISKLAQIYYGDYKLFHAIAQYNGMDDATRVSVGQVIKIPKLKGVRFSPPDGSAQPVTGTEESEPMAEVMDKQEDTAMLMDADTASAGNGSEQILAYRDAGIELYNYQKYEDAIFELNKAIEADPKDPVTREYLAKAYLEAGKQHFDEKDFDAAREAFESARQYDPNCEQCAAFIEKSKLGPVVEKRQKGIENFKKNDYLTAIFQFQEYLQVQPDDQEARLFLSKSYYQQARLDFQKGDYLTAKKGFDAALEYDPKCKECAANIEKSLSSFKESHYNRGIIFFNQEQLPEAIAQWERVYEVDPSYKDVEQNLKRARALLEKLEKIKKSRQ